MTLSVQFYLMSHISNDVSTIKVEFPTWRSLHFQFCSRGRDDVEGMRKEDVAPMLKFRSGLSSSTSYSNPKRGYFHITKLLVKITS